MDQAIAGGADIVDLKDPAQGALGAWQAPALAAAVARWRALGPKAPALSATIGDHPLAAEAIAEAARRVADLGVPLVKIGFELPAEDAATALAPCLHALAPLARTTRLIAVLMADRQPDLSRVPDFVDPQPALRRLRGRLLPDSPESGAGEQPCCFHGECGIASHSLLSRTMALRVTIIFRMAATMMSLCGFPAALRRSQKSLMRGLHRFAVVAAM